MSKTSFRGKVGENARRDATASYGYLNLPRGVHMWAPEPGGRYRIDILPYEVTDPAHLDRADDSEIAIPGSLWYKKPFRIHRKIGPSSDSLVCPTTIGKPCPICEYRAAQVKAGAAKEETDPLKVSMRNLYVVVPLDDKKADKVPHVWDMSQHLFQNLLREELEDNEQYEEFPDLENGWTLRVRFDSKVIGDSKPFAEASRIDFEERAAPYKEKILDEVPDLDNLLTVHSYAHIERLFLEISDPGEEETTGRETSRRDRAAPAAEPGRRDQEHPRGKSDDDGQQEEAAAPPRRPRDRRDADDPAPSRSRQRDDDGQQEEAAAPPRRRERTPSPEPEAPAPQRSRREPEPEPEPPARQRRAPAGQCPHGFQFGVDTDEYNECGRCNIWEKCIDAKENKA